MLQATNSSTAFTCSRVTGTVRRLRQRSSCLRGSRRRPLPACRVLSCWVKLKGSQALRREAPRRQARGLASGGRPQFRSRWRRIRAKAADRTEARDAARTWRTGTARDNPRFVITNLRQSSRFLYERVYCACCDLQTRVKEQPPGCRSPARAVASWPINSVCSSPPGPMS